MHYLNNVESANWSPNFLNELKKYIGAGYALFKGARVGQLSPQLLTKL